MSPCLWLAFFNTVIKRLRAKRAQLGLENMEYTDVVFADDITTLITAGTQEDLQIAARFNAEALHEVLKEMLLQLNAQKCQNIVFNPMLLPMGIFRRSGRIRFPTTTRRLRNQRKAEAAFLPEPIDFDPQENANVANAQESNGFPFPITDTVKVLGVTIDSQFTLDEHFKNMCTKAAVRQSILSKVANSHWGLELGTLHITHNAVINSLLRYALAITGSVFPPDLVRRVNTQIINVAASKIGGANRTARIECMHFIMNAMT